MLITVNYDKEPEEMLREANLYVDTILRLPRGIFVAWKKEEKCDRAPLPTGVKALECEPVAVEDWIIPTNSSRLFKQGFRGATTEELLVYTAAHAKDSFERAIIGTGTKTWWCAFGPGYYADNLVVPAVGMRGRSFSPEPADWKYKGCTFLAVKEVG